MPVKKVFLTVFVGLCVSLSAFTQDQATGAEEFILHEMRIFAEAVKSQDQQYFEEYVGEFPFLPDSGDRIWEPGLKYFLFGTREDQQPFQKDSISIRELAELGELRIIIIWQSPTDFDTYFVPELYFAEIWNEGFWSAEWMAKYFACSFRWDKGELSILGLCYWASGGPFHEYG